MPVGYSKLPELLPIAGVRLATVASGIRYQDRNDLVAIELAADSQCAAVFTQNNFCAAPVVVARNHLAKAAPRFLLINSGNANAGTGQPGMDAAMRSCVTLAEKGNCSAQQVLPFSTGVIGELLPVERMESAFDALLGKLSEDGWHDAAHGIMTTDTVAKGLSTTVQLGGQTITITGICKGSGMIRPDMATMLAYIATDVVIEQDLLQACLTEAVGRSFNRITVDGDTSTNDACVLMSSGRAGNAMFDKDSADYRMFCAAISEVCEQLAQLIIRDAEGASKFITIEVNGGANVQECLQVAYTVAHSPLVKTALFASDPNWGRILAAVGRAGLQEMDINKIEIYLDEVCIVHNGGVAPGYREEDGQRVMDQDEISIRIKLGRGEVAERVWTSDLSHEYVRINAEYRS